MHIDNKTDLFLSGPIRFVGYTFLFFGVSFLVQKAFVSGTICLFITSFALLTYTGVEIDTYSSRIRQYNKLFGLIKTGKWKNLSTYIGVTLIPMKKVSMFASLSNRTTTTTEHFYRIFLVSKARKPAIAIKVCKNREKAQNSLDEFAVWLKMPVFSVRWSVLHEVLHLIIEWTIWFWQFLR